MLRLTVERERVRERGEKTSGAYHWLLLSQGGGGLEDEERGWEKGCVCVCRGGREIRSRDDACFYNP